MKYPCTILKGNNSKGYTLSIGFANGKNIIHDSGAKIFHIGKNTKSHIIAKSIAQKGGQANYRGKIFIDTNASNSKSKIECHTLLLDNFSSSKTIPFNISNNNTSKIEHEAFLTKLDEDQIKYLNSKGISTIDAIKLITLGFLRIFTDELPLEYAVELNQLIKLDISKENG